MEITTVFQKERRDFGRPTTHFAPSEPVDLGGFDCDIAMRDKYIERNPSVLEVQAIPSQSEHQVSRAQHTRAEMVRQRALGPATRQIGGSGGLGIACERQAVRTRV